MQRRPGIQVPTMAPASPYFRPVEPGGQVTR